MIIIGIAGKARTGKDTAACYLLDAFCLEPLSFAAPIKDAIARMFNLTDEHMDGALKETPIDRLGKSPRELFQSLGTEWGRELVHPDVWVLAANNWLVMLRSEYAKQGVLFPGVVFSDVRFENEAAFIRSQNGLVIHLRRDDAPTVATHKSEQHIDIQEGDLVVQNSGTLDELYQKLHDIVLAKAKGV